MDSVLQLGLGVKPLTSLPPLEILLKVYVPAGSVVDRSGEGQGSNKDCEQARMSIGHLMPESPDLVDRNEDGRARQLVGRLETCTHHRAISTQALTARLLPRRFLAHIASATTLVAVTVVLVKLRVLQQKVRR